MDEEEQKKESGYSEPMSEDRSPPTNRTSPSKVDENEKASKDLNLNCKRSLKNKDPLAIVAPLVAELIGTFFLTAVVVLLSCSPGVGPDTVPIAVGLIVVVAILTFGPVSGGHMNVVVSATFALLGELHVVMFIGYVIFQLLGALLAALFSKFVLEHEAYLRGGGGMALRPSITTVGEKMLIDTIFTFFFATILCHMPYDTKDNKLVAFGAGLYVSVAIYATRDIGGHINPTVAAGAAIAATGTNFTSETSTLTLNEAWTDLGYLTIGDILGTILAVTLYRFVTTKNPQFRWHCCPMKKRMAEAEAEAEAEARK